MIIPLWIGVDTDKLTVLPSACPEFAVRLLASKDINKFKIDFDGLKRPIHIHAGSGGRNFSRVSNAEVATPFFTPGKNIAKVFCCAVDLEPGSMTTELSANLSGGRTARVYEFNANWYANNHRLSFFVANVSDFKKTIGVFDVGYAQISSRLCLTNFSTVYRHFLSSGQGLPACFQCFPQQKYSSQRKNGHTPLSDGVLRVNNSGEKPVPRPHHILIVLGVFWLLGYGLARLIRAVGAPEK